ncbi:hypothetical protein Ab1vBOLIVR5_gp41c [Agrobacterium phage OLIVR5]|uniref:Uncharacterized protein n=1 Tax=Agrobacterium phage OLIVR5 TaxID=2723773 RepID=A0A858MSW0_9CAUD|nr:hypothetical protein KNU99_gp041 [Agrobacterium phage OLIVR5]QIW87689.1 hypothetical protein Ab1vBOLIVR5_gp41c [Agrobacterium phage OLIVR5]QIW87951.1 hypothetical protein Ab1vBOLIVR6_gp44c [Agrobacterium phage OLIVR6]
MEKVMDFLSKSYSEISNYSSYPLILKVAPGAPCAPIAIRILTGLPEEDIISKLDRLDPTWRKDGVCDHHALQVIKSAGLGFYSLTPKLMSEANFRMMHPRGDFYISTYGHAYVISDSVTYDPYGPRGRRRVHTAYRIERN